MAHLQLEGNVDNLGATQQEVIDSLREDVESLQQENRKLRNDLIKARADSDSAIAAITALRAQLNPLYRALRAVFGEITLVLGEEEVQAQPRSNSPVSAGNDPVQNLDKWEGVKRRLGGKEADVIEVLLTTGRKTNSQLAPMVKMHYSNLCKITKKLNSLGFIERQGDYWELRQ